MAKGQIWVSPRGNNHNSGSSSSPLKNIQAALNKAPDGTDVMVKAGIYTENLRLYHNNISLISADGHHDATIRPASQNSSTIAGFGVEGTTIRGFVIDGANNANAIHFGMSSRGFSDPVRKLTIQDNKIHGSGEDGVKVSQAYNVKVLHNEITNSGGEGVDFVAVNNSQIAGNNVRDTDGTAGIVVKGGSTNDDIVNNKVWDANVNGISVGGWTGQKWMWPGARSYEAKDVTVTGNEVWDVNKSAILVSGARDSLISKNYLHPKNDYDAVVWIDRSVSDHPRALYSENITLSGNIVERGDWLRVNKGNHDGLKSSGNKVGSPGEVAGASGSAADQKIAVVDGSTEAQHLTTDAPATHVFMPDTAIDAGAPPEMIAIPKADLPAEYDVGDDDHSGLVVNTGAEFIVYSHVPEVAAPTDGAARNDGAGADEHLYFQLPGDTAGTTASAALTKWQALEDAAAHVDTAAVVADQSHTQDAQNHAANGWIL